MFKSATSYLWGSSSNSKQTTDDTTMTSPHHQTTASLPDLHELHLEEKEFSHANSPKPYHPFSPQKPLYLSPPIDIILDKETKYKLSATSSISFLFSKKLTHNHNFISRCAYFIATNRNTRYLTKLDHIDIMHQNALSDGSITEDQETQTQANVVSSSSILSIINVKDLNDYLDSLNLSKEEKKGILKLCEWVKTEKLSIKLCQEMLMSEIILTYFSSLSPTNPDLFSCWKKWIVYRSDHSLYNVNCAKLKAFFDSGIYSVGFDDHRRPVWFINSECYDDTFGTEIITKASVLWVSSLLWNLSKNEFDLFALRRGLSVYVNLSHWSINSISWSIIQSLKKAMVAFPFHLCSIYVSNIPTFMYLIKQLAAKVVVPHAMEKVIILEDTNEYFKYAPKHKTPICGGGTLKVSPTQWIKDRGFMDYIEPKKHHKSPSSPNLMHYK